MKKFAVLVVLESLFLVVFNPLLGFGAGEIVVIFGFYKFIGVFMLEVYSHPVVDTANLFSVAPPGHPLWLLICRNAAESAATRPHSLSSSATT